MKLQKQFSRKVNNVKYFKYVIVLSSKVIEKIGWKEGQKIEVDAKKDKIILRRKKG